MYLIYTIIRFSDKIMNFICSDIILLSLHLHIFYSFQAWNSLLIGMVLIY